MNSRLVARCAALFCALVSLAGFVSAQNIAVTTRHAPAINGQARVEGSVQQLLGEDATLNGGAVLTEDLLVPGTPHVLPNGNVTWQGVQSGTGSTSPSNYTLRLNGGVSLRHVRTRTHPPALPTVDTPPAPAGTRNVTLNQASDSAGEWASVRNLTLNGQAGTRSVPPGTYGNFLANGQTALTLGIAGATQPAIYHFQALTLNGQATLHIVGPVIVTTGGGFSANGRVGVLGRSDWLQLRVANGGVTLNGGSTFHGSILAPNGTVIVNGQATLCGTAACDRFRLNGGGLVRWCNPLVGDGNRPPTATAQHVTTAEDQSAAVVLTGSDPDGQTFAFTISAPPTHGSLSGTAPNLTYTPAPNYHGADSFAFTVQDGTASSPPATVSITVTPVNDVPTANPQAVATTEDTPLVVTLTGSDPDGDSLSYGIAGAPVHGTVEKDTSAGAGAGDFIYWPALDGSEPDAFIFLVQDGHGGMAEAIVQVTIAQVDDVPAALPLSITVDEDGEAAVTLVGIDPDGELLSFEIVAGSGPTHGALVGSAPDFIYRPEENDHGADAFSYIAIDVSGDRSAPAMVNIQVRPIDDAPVAQFTAANALEDTPISFTVTATEVDGEALSYEILTTPQHGALSGTGPTFVYTPHADFFGDDSFTFRAVDQANPIAHESAPATVTLHVGSVNDAPVAQAQGVITSEDTAVAIRLAGRDVDGDPLTFFVPIAPGEFPEHGTLASTEDPAVFLYTPAANYTGADSFRFKVRDGSSESAWAEVQIAVQQINDEPVAAPITLTTDEDQPTSLTLSGVDIDDFDLSFQVLAASGPHHGALGGAAPALIYQPAANFFGADQFDYRAIDSLDLASVPARVRITVQPRNDAPVAEDRTIETLEDTATTITLGASDVENDPLTFAIITPPAHGTLEQVAPREFCYQPNADFHGSDGFVYVARDGELDSIPATVTIAVAPVNDAPVAISGIWTTREDTSVVIALQAADVDGDALSFHPTPPIHGTLVQGLEAGSFIYTPGADFHGSDIFTITARDAALSSAPVAVNIDVTPVNDAPRLQITAPASVTAPSAIAVHAVATDDGDPAGSALAVQWSKVSGPGEVAFADAASANTTASYTKAGAYLLRATASDGELSAGAEVAVVVTMPNQPPVVQAGAGHATALLAPVNLAGVVQDDGLPQDASITLQWSKISGPGNVAFGSPTALTTTAAFSAPGDYVLRLRASDSQFAGQAETTVRVLAPNAAPVVVAGEDRTIEQSDALVLTGSVSDDGLPRGGGLSTVWSVVSGPGSAAFSDAFATTTEMTFSQPGNYTLRLTANDGELSATDEVTISITPRGNRAPMVLAGADQSVTTKRAELAGHVSDDGLPADSVPTSAWSKISGPGAVMFGSASSATTRADFTAPGTYVLRLSASDGALTAGDEVIVTAAFENRAPIVNAGPDQPRVSGLTAQLAGSAHDDGLPSGQALSFVWEKVSGPGDATFGPASLARTSVLVSVSGAYVFRLTASDSEIEGADEVSVTFAANEPPHIALTSPLENAEFEPGDVIPITAEALDADGSIQKVEFFADGGKIGEDLSAPFTMLWAGASEGLHRVAAVATDDAGESASTAPVPDDVGISLSGLRWELPCTAVLNATNCYCPLRTTDSTLVEGNAGEIYEIALRFRGVVEKCTYLGGAHHGTTWQIGGVPDSSGFNVYKLEVSDPPQVYYVNRGASGDPEIYLIDFIETIRARGGATITLTGDSVNGIQHSNYRNFVVPGITPAPAPYNGQFVQMDVVSVTSDAGTTVHVRPPCVLPPAGAVAWWPGEGNANDLFERVPGTALGGLAYAPGKIGQAFSFPVAGARVRVPATPVLNVGTGVGLTFECWIRPDSLATQIPILEWNNEAGGFGVHFWASVSFGGGGVGSLFLNLADTAGANHVLTTPPGTLAAGTLQHIAATYDRASGRALLYLNGAVIAAQTLGSFTPNTASAFHLGYRPSGNSAGATFRGLIDEPTIYDRALSAAQIAALFHAGSSGKCPPSENDAPAVEAGVDVAIGATGSAALAGVVSDDGYPRQAALSAAWSVVSGSGFVTFSNPASPVTTATFAAPGAYRLRLTASDGALSASDELTIFVEASANPNAAPTIHAGADQTLVFPATMALTAVVSDDGLPANDLSVVWSQVSGPTAVFFGGANQIQTTATFTLPGVYVLRATASDTQLARIDELTVTVTAPSSNLPPVVSAGLDQTAVQFAAMALAGSAADDGVPIAPLSVVWSKVSGPGSVVFNAPNAVATTATFSTPGVYVLRFAASDSQASASDEVSVTVARAGNQPPTVAAGPDRTVPLGEEITIVPAIADDGLPAGGVSLVWSVVSGPGGAGLRAVDGGGIAARFARVGSYVLRLTVDDGALEASDEVAIDVTAIATAPPVVALTAPAHGSSVFTGETIVLIATAADPDPDGRIASVAFYDGQTWLGADHAPSPAGEARLTWTGAASGSHTITALATDFSGTTAVSAPVALAVTPAQPSVALTYPAVYSAFAPGGTVRLQATASPARGGGAPLVSVQFLVNGAVISGDPSAPYAIDWSAPSTPGDYTLTARATDADGRTATSAAVLVRVATDPAAPTVLEMLAPLDGERITAPTAITGTVTGPALRDYTLQYRQVAECSHWVTFANGSGAVTDAALGTFDPTLLLNGTYEIRLVAREANGGQTFTSRLVSVEGDMKVGHFTVAFNDLTVPLAGLPITVTRTYDSRDQCPGDFGTGWKLNLEMLRLEKSHPLGDGWEIIVTEGTASTPSTYQLYDAAAHVLTVRMPDGDVLRFTPKVVVDRPYSRLASMLDGGGDDVGQSWLPFQYTQRLKLIYRASSDAKGATLRAVGYRAFDPWLGGSSTVNGDTPLYVSEPYGGSLSLAIHDNSAQDAPLITDATGWELTTQDGRLFTFDDQGRLLSMRDRPGNALSIVRDGAARVQKVVHSSGKELVFHRDARGLIERITDPRGNETHYGYDALGRLTTFFDRDADLAGAATTTFTYSGSTHLLSDLFDGKGVRAAKNYYDAEGRIQRTVDAQGKETIFTHNVAGRTETIRDRAGHTTRHVYDERGNVIHSEQPDGSVVVTGYHVYGEGRKSDLKASESVTGLFSDGAGGLAQKTLTTSYRYEDDDPATPLANDGLLRKLIDPRGKVTTFGYDERGNLLRVTDPLERTTWNTYYPNSNLLHTGTDPAGHVTSFTYDARGQMDTETRTVTVVDAAGASSVQTLVTDSDYDASGYLVQFKDARGHVTTYENDTNGNRIKETTTRTVNGVAVPVVTEHEYDGNDRLVKTWDAEHPRAGPPSSETVFDENGKPAMTYDALRRETSYRYNVRGLLERADFADGTNEETLYDAEGRREYSYDRRGKATQFKYDALGRLTETWFLGSVGDAPVQFSVTQYDAAGRVWKSTDARHETTTYIYDDAGRRIGTLDARNEASGSEYDDAGNLRFFTDAKGHTTEYRYDLLNRRVRTIFPPAEVWNGTAYQVTATEISTTYDELGRRTSETDQSGKTKRFVYDELGRLTAVVDALGQVTSCGYDELGHQLSQTDANQHTTKYSYDQLGRRLTRTLPGTQSESMQYDGAGNLRFRTDFNGRTTEYRYDALDRLRFRLPTGAAGENVEWRYSASGRRERMLDASGETIYGYDARDRLTSKATPQGTLGYGYDAAGNLLSIDSSTPDGAQMTYTYDELGRLDTVTDRNAQTTDYGYDHVGNLQSVALSNGVVSGYGYNALNRLTGLTVNRGAATLQSYQYGLHPTGHRRAVVEASGRASVYGYDALWRLRSEMISGDPAGKNGHVTYGLDPVGNRLSRTSTVAGLASQNFTYNVNDRVNGDTYDANGNTKTAPASQPAGAASAAPEPIRGTDSYDSSDRLISRTGAAGAVQVVYNGDGHKVQESVTQGAITTVTTFLVDELNPTGYAQVVEEKTNGTLSRVYTYGHDLISQDAYFDNDWHLSYYGYDGHGSVRFLTNELGQVTDTYDYDAFGTLLAEGGATPNRYLYCGEQYDSALGLYYLRARLMNPLTGRFWTADSYEGSKSEPLSLHKYLYANADPTNRSDPSGYFSLSEIAASTRIASSIRVGGIAATVQTGSIVGVQVAGLNVAFRLNNAALAAIEAGDWERADSLLLWQMKVADTVSASGGFNDVVQTAVGAAGVTILVKSLPAALKAAPQLAQWFRNLPRLLSRTSDAAKKTTVVIGENMGRVKDFAGPRGYQTIGDWLKTTGRTWDEAANADWVKWVKQQGHDVADIGPDFSRRLDFKIDATLPSARPPSLVYGAERLELLEYGGYQRVFQRTGKYGGGVPGFDP